VQERQWLRSVQSLRQHNTTIPVCMCIYDWAVPWLVRDGAARYGVAVTGVGDYGAYLSGISPHGATLALLPTLHKILSLRHLPDNRAQILYLDCDTVFTGDVERLFDDYCNSDWYAREEPMTRRSRRGPDPSHVDEDALRSIAEGELLRPVAPFNSGVWLMNNRMWADVDRLRFTFLDFAWRLLVGWYLSADPETPLELRVASAVAGTSTDIGALRALRYPSSNLWILDQVALWLALGELRRSPGLFGECDVPQGGDCLDALDAGRPWIVAHYFSVLEQAVLERLSDWR
jgi:hypothetical protein